MSALPARVQANPIQWVLDVEAQLPQVSDMPALGKMSDLASALHAYLSGQLGRASEEARRVAEVRVRVQRRIGELLPPKPTPEASGSTGGRGKKGVSAGNAFSRKQVHDARKLASVPAEEFDAYIEDQRAKRKAPSSSGALRLALSIRPEGEPGLCGGDAFAELAGVAASGKRYATIYADPPWDYQNWTDSKQGAAASQYKTMPAADIAALPIGDIAAKNCALLMWATFPKMREAIQVIDGWGFRYVTCAFVWRKVYRDGSPYCGLGFYTRSAYEVCLLGLRGSVQPAVKDMRQEVTAPVGRHSAKPIEVYGLIERLFPQAIPRIELFCRSRQPDWDGWGNQVTDAMPIIQGVT